MNKEINLGNLIIPVIKPQKGKDYYTETEKQELISIVTDNVNAGVLPQEQTRQSNEIIRQNNEQTRQAQETIRQTNETNRQTAETERESAENTRQSNESSRVSAEQTRTQTFNNKMDEVDTAIAGIHTSQNAYDQNATAKTSAFNENATSKTSDYNTNATNKTAEYNENASTKIAEYDAHIRDYEAELATKVDKVAGKGLSTNDFTNEEKEKLAELHNYDDTELSERVDDIEQEQTEQNTNISTNATNIESLQEENENLKKIVSQLPQVTGQGTEVTLENTIEAPFTKFDVEGNSVQDGSPSPDNEVPIYSAGDNENLFDKDNEEQFLQNLTPDNNGLIVSAQTSTTSANYIRTIIIPCKSDANYAITRFLGGKMFFIYESDEYPTLNKQTTLLKRNNDAGKVSEIIKTSATAKYLLVKIYNTYASEYYTYDELISSIKIEKGNKATPYSPYGMGSINEKISNKNVWNIDKFKNLYGTNTYETYNNIECLKLAGATQRYNFQGEENTQYTFQFKLIGSTLNNEIGAFSLVYSDGTFDYHDGILTPKTYTFTSKANKTLVKIVWNAWSAGHFIYIDKNSMQLEPGSTATPYVPPQEQDYSIFVQQPMRSIGDVRDCFVKKSDGWYERHLPYIASYNGETLPQDVYNEVDNVKYCNEKSMSTTGQFSIGASVQYIDENNWNDLLCTETQIQQLENLPSTYKDFTIINSEDETEAYLEVAGIYDLNKLINN